MSKSKVRATPAIKQEGASLPINNPISASARSFITELHLPGISHFAGTEPQDVVTEEDDLVDPAALIERLMRTLNHRLDEVVPVATEGLAAVLVAAIQPLVVELMAMHAALRVGMKVEEWTANFLRTAEISCEPGQLDELLCEYMDSVGVAWTHEANA